MTGKDVKVCLGIITGAHGVKGEVRVESFTETARDVVAYGPLTDLAGARAFELKIRGEARGQLIARIPGVDDRNAAEALKGQHLYVPRAALPALGAGEFYRGDLVGLACVLADGTSYGTVKAVHNFGAGGMIEIERLGEKGLPGVPSVLFPFTRSSVPEIDLERGRLTVAPPPEVEVGPENAAAGSDSGTSDSGASDSGASDSGAERPAAKREARL
jgi:16S rRNA processing protein RimM